MNVNITKNAIKIAVAYGGRTSPYYKPGKVNLTGISPNALKDGNDFLASKGETALDEKSPEQNIAALWLAASLYYDPSIDNAYPAYDIAMPFGLARADSSSGSAEEQQIWFGAPIQLF